MDVIRTISRSVKDDNDSDHHESSPTLRQSANNLNYSPAVARGNGVLVRTNSVEGPTSCLPVFSTSTTTSSPMHQHHHNFLNPMPFQSSPFRQNSSNAIVHAVLDREPSQSQDEFQRLVHPDHPLEDNYGSLACSATEVQLSETCPAEIPCESAAEVGGSFYGNSRHVDDDDEEEEEEVDDDEDEYEYEDEDDSPFTGFLVDNPSIAAIQPDEGTGVYGSSTSFAASSHPTKIEDEEAIKPKWREPTREAVNMSLRVEQETSGSKRRLAQDLYRIMNQDTQEAGFSLQPSSEDSMDKWTIKLFQFDEDSNLAKDMKILGVTAVELEMMFPDQYPFEPPFVRVVRPRFKKQTGFVMNGALCMELLTKDGWNPINDIESVIVSVRSLLVVGDGRLEAAASLSEAKYAALLAAEEAKSHLLENATDTDGVNKRQRKNSAGESILHQHQQQLFESEKDRPSGSKQGGSYSVAESKAAYNHLSDYHKKKGWDASGWWARKG